MYKRVLVLVAVLGTLCLLTSSVYIEPRSDVCSEYAAGIPTPKVRFLKVDYDKRVAEIEKEKLQSKEVALLGKRDSWSLAKYVQYVLLQSYAQNLLHEVYLTLEPHLPKYAREWQYEYIIVDQVDSVTENAYAIPGGPIIFTLGMLRTFTTVDEVAFTQAHEIAHVALRTGALQKEQEIKAFLTLKQEYRALVEQRSVPVFEWARLVKPLGVILFPNKENQGYERQADLFAMHVIGEAGYDMSRVIVWHKVFGATPDFDAWESTHPSQEKRIELFSCAPPYTMTQHERAEQALLTLRTALFMYDISN